MAVSEATIDKIRKLLALAGNNPNEHEAAAAAAKAQDMMREHDLSMSQVDIKQDPRTAGINKTQRETLAKAGKPGGWKVDLYKAVAETSGCWAFVGKQRSGYDGWGYMVGRAQDIEIAEYLYQYLVREIERLQDEFGKTRWAELREYAAKWGMTTHAAETDYSQTGRHPLKAKNDWMKGAAPAVISALRQYARERDSRTDSDRALVLSKETAIRDWYAQQRGFKTWDDMQAHSKAYWDGVETKMTPAQRRKAEQQAEAAARRAWAKAERRGAREAANMDWDAYNRGVEAGRTVGIRPGIK